MKLQHEFMWSILIGLSTGIIVIVVGFILDLYIDAKVSNFITLIVGLVYNFLLQNQVFQNDNQKFTDNLKRYIVADMLILLLNQMLMNYLIDHKKEFIDYLPKDYKKYYVTSCRILVGLIVWIFLSFPIRKYWVYA